MQTAQTVLYFILWAGLIFVMMRFGCGAHVMGHGSHRRHRTGNAPGKPPPPNMTDPVCGMTVEPATAKSSVFGGVPYYFCSNECRAKFEAAPGKYVSQSLAAEKEHHHG